MEPRPGVVLVAALLALLAMEAVALGLLFLATQEIVVARAHERALRSRLAAEDVALDAAFALADGRGDAAAGTPGSSVDPETGGASLIDAPGWIVARATARDGGGASGRAALLLERPDPHRFRPIFDTESTEPDSTAAAARLRLLAELRSLPAADASGDLLLRPVHVDGDCSTADPANWGAPGEPSHPCFGHVPLLRVEGTVRAAAGAGQAIIIVTGTMTVAAPATVDAAIVVYGHLEVEAGARVHGAVAVMPGGSVGGEVLRDDVMLDALLAAALPLRRPVAAARLWLPAFEHRN